MMESFVNSAKNLYWKVKNNKSYSFYAIRFYKSLTKSFNRNIFSVEVFFFLWKFCELLIYRNFHLFVFSVEVFCRYYRSTYCCSYCWILGNCYFNKGYPNASYPAFISHVICSPNPKQYIFFVEPNWEDVQIRHNYVSHIATFRTHFNPKDNAIILYNKIDKCPLYITPTGYVDIRIAAKDCQNQYAGLFDIFRRRIPILRWFYPYIFTFIPFSSGFFYQDVSGTYKYEASIDLYPQKLWKEIMKAVRR